jgi:hypothetical protein
MSATMLFVGYLRAQGQAHHAPQQYAQGHIAHEAGYTRGPGATCESY